MKLSMPASCDGLSVLLSATVLKTLNPAVRDGRLETRRCDTWSRLNFDVESTAFCFNGPQQSITSNGARHWMNVDFICGFYGVSLSKRFAARAVRALERTYAPRLQSQPLLETAQSAHLPHSPMGEQGMNRHAWNNFKKNTKSSSCQF